MDVLKRNAYWVTLGVLVLLAAAFYGIAVAGGRNLDIKKQKSSLDSRVREIQRFAGIPEEEVADPEKGLPVNEIVSYWETRKAALEKEVEEILKMYRARDREFERLLRADPKTNTVDYTTFVTELRDKVTKDLKEKYKSLIQEGAQADKVFPIEEPRPGDDAQMARAQKQFNIAKEIAAAAKEAGATAIVGMEFKEVARAATKDSKEAKGIGAVACEAEIRMPFPGLAKLVSKILRSNVIFEIREIKVEAAPFTLPAFEPFKVFGGGPRPPGSPGGHAAAAQTAAMKGFDKDVYIATSDQANPETKGRQAPDLEEPPVGVTLVLHALDFDLEGAEKGGKK